MSYIARINQAAFREETLKGLMLPTKQPNLLIEAMAMALLSL